MLKQTDFKLRQALSCLQRSGVIAYPTESVYGLGCNPFDFSAVQRLLELKGRDIGKGLILVAANIEQVKDLLPELDEPQLKQISQSTLQTPVTYLVADPYERIPFWIKGDHDSVAIRVSHHPVVQALCLAFGCALVSSSANLTGRQPATSALKVRQQFKTQLDYIVAAELGDASSPSQIKDLLTQQIIRN